MAFWEWGAADAPVVLCVHGLTRNGRDFDPLAEALADRFRVICPDLPGRGASEWLPEAKLYEPPATSRRSPTCSRRSGGRWPGSAPRSAASAA